MKINQHTCKVCKASYSNPDMEDFMCHNCENEYAEWLEANGLVIGEFDWAGHPNYKQDVHKGTKWEVIEA